MEFLLSIFSALLSNNDPLMNTIHALLLLIAAGLIVILIWLARDRKRIIKALKEKDQKIIEIIEKYHQGQNITTSAMQGVKEVLIELKTVIGIHKY